MSRFATTRWSLVLAAREDGEAAATALATLCERYRAPALAFVRARGHPGDEAEDLVQGFFLKLLEKRYDLAADPRRGRFRSFLLAALKGHLANAHDAATADRRGGRVVHTDLDAAERDDLLAAGDGLDRAFDREFALAVIERALLRLHAEAEADGRGAVFARLAGFALEAPEAGDYPRLGAELAMTTNAVAATVKRLRQRLAALVRAELAETLADPGQLDAEMRALRAALRG